MFRRFLFLVQTYAHVTIRYKDESLLMQFLGFFVKFFNPRFAEDYATTIGDTIYLPKSFRTNPQKAHLPLIAHEVVHILDYHRLTPPVYYFLYLFPQILAPLCLLSLFAIWFSNWWLLSLFALGFLSPLPAPGRVYLEKRGYLMSLAALYWAKGDWNPVMNRVPYILNQFMNSAYYYMSRKSQLLHLSIWFRQKMGQITEEIYPDKFFEAVHDFIIENKETQDG